MRKFDIYWQSNKDWFYFDGFMPKVKDDAPQEAKDSYKHYLQQTKEAYKDED